MERSLSRRTFLRHAALGGAGLALASSATAAPLILTTPRTRRRTVAGTLAFRPYYVQRGPGPHLEGTYAYASDTKWDAFHSNINASENGVYLSDTEGQEQFGINTRWNVEGFGSGYITADNGGAFYTLPPAGQTQELNLNFELAKSRVYRNRRRMASHQQTSGAGQWRPSRELEGLQAISEGYFEDAEKVAGEEVRRAELAQKALYYALLAGEKLEIEKAQHDILLRGYRPDFFMGCDTKSFFLMDQDTVRDRFLEVFNYATITYYWQVRWNQDFEPSRGEKRYGFRDAVYDQLKKDGITVEGRPLFWPHKSVTPDWLRQLSYDDLLKYVEQHVREVVGHYDEGMYAWEVVNEFHDWANETNLSPEQTVEVTRLACDVARDTAPNVHRLINNCCPFAEYVQMGEHSGGPTRYPQRTPWEFMRDLKDAEVDFTITGVQMYFPYRDLQDTIIHIERFEEFGRPVQLTEVGASSGPSKRSVVLDSLEISSEPYLWHRPWDEALQADWLEGLYTLGYSKPWIEAVNWYDFDDDHAFIKNGGLLKSPLGEPKAAFHRLKRLQDEWKSLGS